MSLTKGSSRLDRQPNKDRVALFHAELFYNDYFSPTSVLDATSFHEVYRMRKYLILRLHDVVCSNYDYFEQKTNCVGTIGFPPCKKTTVAMCMLSLGTPAKA